MAPVDGFCGYADCTDCVDNLCFFVEFLNRTFSCKPSIENLDNLKDWFNTSTQCPPAGGDLTEDCIRFDFLVIFLLILAFGIGSALGCIFCKIFKMPGQYGPIGLPNYETWRQRGARFMTWMRIGVRWLGILERVSTCCIRVGEGLVENEVLPHVVQHAYGPNNDREPRQPVPQNQDIVPAEQPRLDPPAVSDNSSESTESNRSEEHQDQSQDPHQDQAFRNSAINQAGQSVGNIPGNIPPSSIPTPGTSALQPAQITPAHNSRQSRPSSTSRIPLAVKSYGTINARSASSSADTQELRRSTRTRVAPKRLSPM